MGLSTFTELKTLISGYLQQDDLSDSVLTDLVRLAEERMDVELRVRQMQGEDTGNNVPGTGKIALPSGFVETASFVINRDNGWPEMEHRPPNEFFAHEFRNSLGAPRIYTEWNGNLEVLPIPDGSYVYEHRYYSEIPRLNATTQTTNDILTTYPRLYLFAALAEAEPYLVNDARVATWEGKYDRALSAVNGADMRRRYRPRRRSRVVNTGTYEGRRTFP